MTNTDNFYCDIPESHSMEDIFNSQYSRAVPNDWLLLITDVVQSTQAIEEGRYKDVNIAGGLAVMAITNLNHSMNFPFIFGGDGVTMLIPRHLETAARAVLIDTRDKVKATLNLQLRIGIVSIPLLYNQGYQLRIAKLRLSPHYVQAIIDGDGLDIAEAWVKSSNTHNPFLITDLAAITPITADFSGFTCRWQDVMSTKGEIVALIVKFRATKGQARKKELTDLLAFITKYYGQESDYHPIEAKQMHMGGLKLLRHEIDIRCAGYSHLMRWRLAIIITIQFYLIKIIQRLHIPIHFGWVDIVHLKAMNIISADFCKFDGSLKMVISGTTANRQQLMAYLESGYQDGRLCYGVHVSNRALLTCLLHFNSQSEVHFVDGGEGGYAMAAKQLKAQLKTIS